MDLITATDAAGSLDMLLDILRDYPATTLREERRMTELPTFGGEEPQDTDRVWSWDETRLLVGTGSADFKIVARAEWQEREDERRQGHGPDAPDPTEYHE